MALLATLRTVAKSMGIPASDIRSATTAEELGNVIEAYGSGNSTGNSKVRAKAKKKNGRPVRKTVRRKSAPAVKSTRGEAKRPTTAKRSTSKRPTTTQGRTSKAQENAGRNLLDSVDFSPHEDWNPREGSCPDRIIKALRKYRGNRDKVYDFLAPDVWEFVGKVKADGSKRTKDEAFEMLVYRISRTAWEFAVRTGQHDPAHNRAEYGTAGTGTGAFQEAQKRGGSRKATPAARKSQKRAQSVRETPKRETPKRATAKRSTAKRGTAKRQTAKRATTKRAVAKRGAAKRRTARR